MAEEELPQDVDWQDCDRPAAGNARARIHVYPVLVRCRYHVAVSAVVLPP